MEFPRGPPRDVWTYGWSLLGLQALMPRKDRREKVVLYHIKETPHRITPDGGKSRDGSDVRGRHQMDTTTLGLDCGRRLKALMGTRKGGKKPSLFVRTGLQMFASDAQDYGLRGMAERKPRSKATTGGDGA